MAEEGVQIIGLHQTMYMLLAGVGHGTLPFPGKDLRESDILGAQKHPLT